MATVPISATNVRLLKQIPFHNDYKHTRYFASRTLQTNYFLAKPVVYSMTNVNFQRVENRTIVRVDRSIDQLREVNYLMFQNSQYNNKWFYGFVTKLEYMNKNTTHVHFELDVYQTWCKDYTLKPSYVVREHCKLWRSDGSPIINTVDEGLDYGSEYDTVKVTNYKVSRGYKWLVILSKTRLHTDKENDYKSSLVGVVQPLTYYVIPFREDNLLPPSIRIGIGGVVQPITPIDEVLTKIYDNERVVNNIVSMYVTDNIGIPVEASVTSGYPTVLTLPNNVGATKETIANSSGDLHIITINNVKEFTPVRERLSNSKYDGFTRSVESKLLMYPYCLTTVDDFKGNRVDIKNEYVSTNVLDIISMGSLGTSNKVSYSIANYNQSGIDLIDGTKVSLENSIIDNNPNDVAIITEHLASFLQGNRNSIQNQKNSIMFNTVANTVSNGVNAGASALMSGSNLPLVSGGMNIVKGAGNGVLKLQGIQAKQKDIGNTPPQITKMGSNTSFDFGNRYNGVWIIKKQIKPEYQKKLEDFFNMFGYKVNEVKTPNIVTRKYWNYVQTENCMIDGSFNHEDMLEIKALYDNGITFWHTDDIGNYSLENEVL